MATDRTRGTRPAGDPAHDSPKRQGDKLGSARGAGRSESPLTTDEAAGDPAHDSPKRHGDKLERARDAAAGRKR